MLDQAPILELSEHTFWIILQVTEPPFRLSSDSAHSCPRQGAFHCVLPSGFCLQFDPLKKTGGNISKYNVLSKNSVIFSEWFSILDLHVIQDLKRLSRVGKGLTVH